VNLCECGNLKTRSAGACDRCSYLDGRSFKQAAVIAALRDTGGASLTELADAIGDDGPSARRAMLKTTQTLMRDGRLGRYLRENDAKEITAQRLGRAQRFRTSASTSWVYVLRTP
jgi:hypothetical protein